MDLPRGPCLKKPIPQIHSLSAFTDSSAVGNGRSSLPNGLVHSDSSSSENTNTQNHGDSSGAGGALEEARFRYKNSVMALRAVLAAIPNSLKEASETGSPADETEVEKLEQRASNLRKELVKKIAYITSYRSATRSYHGHINLAKSLFRLTSKAWCVL